MALPPDRIEGFYADLRKEDREKIDKNKATKIFLFLSVFYQYEIPIVRKFLSQFLDGEIEIELLLQSKTISGDIELLGLPHSAIANLFIETANYDSYLKSLTEEIKEKTRSEAKNLSWDSALLYSYMWSYPEKVNYFITRLPGKFLENVQKLKEFPFLLKEIFEKVEFFDWDCYWAYENFPKDKFEKVNEIEGEEFAQKIEKWENPSAIAYLLKTLKEIGYPKLKELLHMLRPESLSKIIKNYWREEGKKELLKTLEELNYPHLPELKRLSSS